MWLRLLRTVLHLRPRQVAYQLAYRLTGRPTARPRGAFPGPPPTSVLPPLPRPATDGLPARLTGPARFSFLNRTVDFGSVPEIDWNYAAEGKLWTYNLNYFDFLRDPGLDPATGLALLRDWTDKAAGHRDGWEPYPLSLRLVNWGQFLRGVPMAWSTDLGAAYARQYADLWRKREYHLDGNHLLENHLALAYAARLLGDEEGRERADRRLLRLLDEQYLADGAHYELSPAYQLVLLWRQLDLLSLPAEDSTLRTALTRSLRRQLGWVAALVDPLTGFYPHFNDSAPGIAPEPAAVFAYARSLGLSPLGSGLGISGYRRWTVGGVTVWIDAAAIGPDHIPGHAHADNLTFELHHRGVPLIVDPATSTYEKNERRRWERSTAAHNTVTVGAADSSEVWGGFRVGARARTTLIGEVDHHLVARHDGYAAPHQRTFDLSGDGSLTVLDRIAGEGTARLHFDHRQSPVLSATTLRCGPLRIEWSAAEVRLTDYQQAVGWNALRPARCLELTFTDRLHCRFSFS